jgi:hypothetical protein
MQRLNQNFASLAPPGRCSSDICHGRPSVPSGVPLGKYSLSPVGGGRDVEVSACLADVPLEERRGGRPIFNPGKPLAETERLTAVLGRCLPVPIQHRVFAAAVGLLIFVFGMLVLRWAPAPEEVLPASAHTLGMWVVVGASGIEAKKRLWISTPFGWDESFSDLCECLKFCLKQWGRVSFLAGGTFLPNLTCEHEQTP